MSSDVLMMMLLMMMMMMLLLMMIMMLMMMMMMMMAMLMTSMTTMPMLMMLRILVPRDRVVLMLVAMSRNLGRRAPRVPHGRTAHQFLKHHLDLNSKPHTNLEPHNVGT